MSRWSKLIESFEEYSASVDAHLNDLIKLKEKVETLQEQVSENGKALKELKKKIG